MRLSVLYVIAVATARNIKCLGERTNTIPLLGNLTLHTQTKGNDTLGTSCLSSSSPRLAVTSCDFLQALLQGQGSHSYSVCLPHYVGLGLPPAFKMPTSSANAPFILKAKYHKKMNTHSLLPCAPAFSVFCLP